MSKISQLILLFCLSASVAMLFTACSESRADNTAPQGRTIQVSEQLAVPQLLSRTEGLGSPGEIADVSARYDAQVASLKQNPQQAEAWIKLAELFINEARITGEHPYYYPHALAMLNNIPASAIQSPDQQFRALYLEASVQLSLHDFKSAYATGEKARQIFPYNAGIHGVLVDAKVEMGEYAEAVELCDKMISLRPDLRSYARVSYLREIHGEVEGSIEAMQLAVSAGVPGYEQTAWCRLNLAQLYETYGSLQDAEMQYQMLLQERPNYPFAIAGLARVAMERGQYQEALAQLDQAIALIPEVGFYEDKAELYQRMGEAEKAQALYLEILTMMEEDAAAGHNMDLEMAQVHLQIGDQPELALATAMKALPGREKNIEVNGVLAEIYFALGDKAQARQHLDIALATGSRLPDYQNLAQQL